MSNPSEQTLSPELLLAKDAVLKRLDAIESSLKVADPLLPIHCQEVHKTLLGYEELIHILPDEKIRTLMAGMKKYQAIQLIAEASKTRGKGKVTADDL